ncbi:DUF6705 family protein [Lacinutrix undariae]
MKHIIYLFIIFFSVSYNTNAQSPIYALDDWSDGQANAYYKDLNNDLDPFIGTWVYTPETQSLNGETFIKIVLYKKTMYFDGEYYVDLLVGEYQYVKDGVEQINTLANIDQDLGENHHIYGYFISNDCRYYSVDDCVDGEVSVNLALEDLTGDSMYALKLYKRINSFTGQEYLNAMLWSDGGMITLAPGEELTVPTLPYQLDNIKFMKQE